MCDCIEKNVLLNIIKMSNKIQEIFDKIFKTIKEMIYKKKKSSVELIEICMKDIKFQNNINSFNQALDKFSKSLEKLELFNDEFVNLLSIRTMIDHITSDIELLIEYSKFVHDLISSFCNIINFKIDCLNDDDLKIYDGEYQKFDKYWSDNEDFFYLKIYSPTHEFDGLIDEVTNILW